ncbi:ParB/RepB/Spo0J family partition protein [Butyrivibrio sp.]|uniref:ParB/RepB/Spo0J family partition protein n=1 Tax=Butyrivibrio sp. TaxID=28121 RepID=UPI0025B81EAA|nr:ParB/RepB/Spo0J family partition protein [Butyrivibrio sp.]MBE5839278.1 ParB/RepB/Spo0J family partition protein [Butyrivibrio sp.]MBE5843218.1 ParB/RepB/Spo0J family partition protein [Butyrivibrio sp.]
MQKSRGNIQLSSYDDIFGSSEVQSKEDRNGTEQVQDILLSELHPFKNHPFKILDDEAMDKTVESVREFGVLTPAIVRPRDEGGYEIVSGHRRCHASEIAGKETLPCIIRNLDDDAATILMVDANLQREELLPSERAWAFKMKLDAMKRLAGRPLKENASQIGTHLRSDQILAEETGISRNQIQRYIRLTNLLPEILDMVDNKQIGFNPAVELSYLDVDEQKRLLEAMDFSQTTPSLSQAQRIKKMSQEEGLTQEAMNVIMSEEKKSDVDRVTIKNDILRKYFPKSYTPKQMEETIVKLLEQWQKKREREQNLS